MKILLILFTLPLVALAQHATGQTNGYDKAPKETVVVEGNTYPENELPFKIKDHLVLSQSGLCIGFFLANSDIVYGAKTGRPVGFIGADHYLYFSFPTK